MKKPENTSVKTYSVQMINVFPQFSVLKIWYYLGWSTEKPKTWPEIGYHFRKSRHKLHTTPENYKFDIWVVKWNNQTLTVCSNS